MLVLIGPGSAALNATSAHGTIGSVGIGIAFFFALLAAILAFGPVSGAHLNPAVTLGLWTARMFPSRDVIPYIVSQCAGATLASLAIRAAIGPAVEWATTTPAVGLPILVAVCVELVFSAILMLVILRVTTSNADGLQFAPFAVAACVGGLAMLGSLTGSSMNPARSFGPALAANEWRSHWLYWLAPIAGMIVVAQISRVAIAAETADALSFGVEGPILDP